MGIIYRIGDATNPQGNGPRIIVHICNDIGTWGRGFVLALSRRWMAPEQRYRAWFQGKDEVSTPFELGQVQFVQIEPDLWVANLIGQHGVGGRAASQPLPPIRYDAVRQGLGRTAEMAHTLGATIHMPRIGSGLAGGKWEDICKIINEQLIARGLSVTVYDLPRTDASLK